MQKIVPHFWFDSQAEEAATLYAATFKDSNVGVITRYGKEGFEIHGQPEGKVMSVSFELAGQKFMAINGGPIFTFTPAISMLVMCETEAEVDELWAKLSPGGMAMMELGAYPFSKRYGWTSDKFGLSWQIMHAGEMPVTQKITPTLMFVGAVCGKAEEAMTKYMGIFGGSVDHVLRYGAGAAPDKEGTVMHAGFTLAGGQFAAMDSAHDHKFNFNEAVSLMAYAKDQVEIDRLWDALSEGGDPAAQQCGWLKDKYGVSWQVVPESMDAMMSDPDKEKVARVTTAFLQMKKFDLAELQRAADGK